MSELYVITGANRGIGLEFVRQLSSQSHRVIATARNLDSADELKELSKTKEIELHSLDVSKNQSVEAFAQFCEKFGSIDCLINNAGVYLDEGRGFKDLPVEALIDTFNVNVAGNFRVTQALLPFLLKAKQPRAIQISSQMGSIEDNSSGGSYAYRISKTALNMMTRSLAHDFPKLISLCLHPGWVRTNMGGPNAKITPTQSVEGLLKVISGASLKESGQFINEKNSKLPW